MIDQQAPVLQEHNTISVLDDLTDVPTPNVGDVVYHNGDNCTYVFSGTEWLEVGPSGEALAPDYRDKEKLSKHIDDLACI